MWKRQMQAHRIEDSESSSLLRTPAASEAERGHQPEEKARARGGQVTLSGQLNYLPTTRAQHGQNRNNKIYYRDPSKPQNLENALALLPTPKTMDDLPARDESKIDRSKGGYSNVRETVIREFLPTLRASDGYERRNQKTMDRIAQEGGDMTMPTLARTATDWGRFGFAIERWEREFGVPAPAPTKPDGKDGAQRLSSEFTEWMMGLQPGWITSVGLSRKDELKACGNGVVPQQAKLALTILKARFEVE